MSRIYFERLMVTLKVKKYPRFLWYLKVVSISPLEPLCSQVHLEHKLTLVLNLDFILIAPLRGGL